jgi:hypothetical protein
LIVVLNRVDELPRTPLMKIDRRTLRQRGLVHFSIRLTCLRAVIARLDRAI